MTGTAASERNPAYLRVANALADQIISGRYGVGSALPSEYELGRSFGISRQTVRAALKQLSEHGLVRTRAGVGTMVLRSRREQPDATLRGITEDLKLRGLDTSTETISLGYELASPQIRDVLQLPEGTRVVKHVRMRALGAMPLGLSTSYLPEELGVTPEDDFSRPAIDLIEMRKRFEIRYGRDSIRAKLPSPVEQELLQVSDREPLMWLKRLLFTEFDRPIALVEWAIRSDLYDYHVTLKR